MDEKKFVPGRVETGKISAKRWLKDQSQKCKRENESLSGFLERLANATNEDAKLSSEQSSFLSEAIGGVLFVSNVNENKELKELLRLATFINSCR